MLTFSNRLLVLRTELSKNQKEISEYLGVSVQSYSAYENGREPSYDILIKLAKYYNVSTDYLVGITDLKNSENSDPKLKELYQNNYFIDLLNVLQDAYMNQNQNAINLVLQSLGFLSAILLVYTRYIDNKLEPTDYMLISGEESIINDILEKYRDDIRLHSKLQCIGIIDPLLEPIHKFILDFIGTYAQSNNIKRSDD